MNPPTSPTMQCRDTVDQASLTSNRTCFPLVSSVSVLTTPSTPHVRVTSLGRQETRCASLAQLSQLGIGRLCREAAYGGFIYAHPLRLPSPPSLAAPAGVA